MGSRVFWLAAFCLGSAFSSMAFAHVGQRLNSSEPLNCTASNNILSCSSRDAILVVDPSKSIFNGRSDKAIANIRNSLVSAWQTPEGMSRVLLCVESEPTKFIDGIIVFLEGSPSNVYAIKLDHKGEFGNAPDLLYIPQALQLSKQYTDAGLCDQMFQK